MRSGRIADVSNVLFSTDTAVTTVFDLDSLQIINGTVTLDSAFTALGGSSVILNNSKQQSVVFAAAPSTINWRTGAIVNFGLLTAAVTSFAFSASTLNAGIWCEINFTQDSTGGRTVALGSGWKGASIGSGTADQKCSIRARYDGTHWRYFTTGWS